MTVVHTTGMAKHTRTTEASFVTQRPCPSCNGKGSLTAYDGAALRRYREARKVGLNDAAHAMGVSGTHLSNIERDRAQPGTATVRKFLAAVSALAGPGRPAEPADSEPEN